MSRFLAMQQPNFLPWLGYFHKMAQVDVFVLLDSVQVPVGRSYAHRVKIIGNKGQPAWLSLPTHRPNKCSYNEARVVNDDRMVAKVWRIIETNYQHTRFFSDYTMDFERLFARAAGRSLATVNIEFIEYINAVLNLKAKTVMLSDLDDVESSREMRGVDLCHKFDCDVYFSGEGARAYNDEECFAKGNVELHYRNIDLLSKHLDSRIVAPSIIPLSIIDGLFRYGPLLGDILSHEPEAYTQID